MKKLAVLLALGLIVVNVVFSFKASALRDKTPVIDSADMTEVVMPSTENFKDRMGGNSNTTTTNRPLVIKTRVSFSVSTNLPPRPLSEGQSSW